MEAIGLVTWSSWLRPVVAVGSGAYAGAILPEAPRVGGPGSCLKLFLVLLCSLGLGEEQRVGLHQALQRRWFPPASAT